MMTHSRLLFVTTLCIGLVGCARKLTAEEQQTLAQLKLDRQSVQAEITASKAQDALYAGGPIKPYIEVRLEILKTSDALLQQGIDAIESGVKMNIVAQGVKTDPALADQLATDLVAQRQKLAETKAEADRYSEGLVQTLSLISFATMSNIVAMMEQRQMVAKYGFALSTLPGGPKTNGADTTSPTVAMATTPAGAAPAAADRAREGAESCLRVDVFDSSVLSSNTVFTEMAWKANIASTCDTPRSVRVTFTLYDKDEFQLDSDTKSVLVLARGVGRARGRILISPPSKAAQIARQDVSFRGE